MSVRKFLGPSFLLIASNVRCWVLKIGRQMSVIFRLVVKHCAWSITCQASDVGCWALGGMLSSVGHQSVKASGVGLPILIVGRRTQDTAFGVGCRVSGVEC